MTRLITDAELARLRKNVEQGSRPDYDECYALLDSIARLKEALAIAMPLFDPTGRFLVMTTEERKKHDADMARIRELVGDDEPKPKGGLPALLGKWPGDLKDGE